jgi:hypothetical protein
MLISFDGATEQIAHSTREARVFAKEKERVI